MGPEKIVQRVRRRKKGRKRKAFRLLLAIALLANISGCGRKVKIKAPAMPFGVLRGVIADADIEDKICDDILVLNDGKPEFYVSLDERAVTYTATFYVDNDFKDKVGNFDIVLLNRTGGVSSIPFNYNKHKKGIYSNSVEIPTPVIEFILTNKYYDYIAVQELLYGAERVKQIYRRDGKTIIWNFK